MDHSIVCYNCKHTWQVSLPLSRRDECPNCQRDCKVCLNCTFYDPQAYHECRESEAEWVKEKDVGTFCSYFRPRGTARGSQDTMDDLKARLDALFKK